MTPLQVQGANGEQGSRSEQVDNPTGRTVPSVSPSPVSLPRPVVRVVLVPSVGRLGPLDYRVPAERNAVRPGMRVLVPVGPRRCMGVVLEEATAVEAGARLRDIIAVLDTEPPLGASLLRLVGWLAEYYLVPLGEAVATALPGPLRVETESHVEAHAGHDAAVRGREHEVLTVLTRDGPHSMTRLRQRFGSHVASVVARLRRKELVRVSERVRREVTPTRHTRLYEAIGGAHEAEARLNRRPALRQLFDYLRAHPLRRASARELATFPNARAKLRLLSELGLVRSHDEESFRSVLPPRASADRTVTLTPAQEQAVTTIRAAVGTGFAPFLLWGVTGSGKTEVYLQVIAAALARGCGALILVPEISLTHQLVDRVRARFGDEIAVLHSQLSTGERWDEWRRIAGGAASIVIGARSAVFAPLRRLGIIIVDEEHDGAYKQADGLRYHGRDVAVMRAKLEGCPLVLGSATPSMESYYNAERGRYTLLRLPERVESRPLPSVRIVDLRALTQSTAVPISSTLAAALEANLAAGAQSLLFLNRRGFANFLQCRACGEPVMCPHCSVTLTWHRRWRAVRCHYCDYTVARPERCAGCGDVGLRDWGAGTEQIEAVVRERFPAARVGRMDRDTTSRKGSQARLLNEWAEGRLDILVGTQMVTKGHDIAGVTLVGVLLADTSLNLPDFRASERTFQLLAQVSGRAGRGDRPGRVVVQTLQPDHYSLRAAITHDFAGFARRELDTRRELGYPPFTRVVLVRIEGEDSSRVEQLARDMGARLRTAAAGQFAVLGPAAAPLERLRRRYRWQLLLRGRGGAAMRRSAATVVASLRADARAADVRLLVDVDPVSML